MSRARRIEIIAEIEKLRGSHVLCYVTSDRSPIGGLIADDAVRPFYQQLREMGHVPRIDFFLYSRGGAVDAPWRFVNALRNGADRWEVLVPWRAQSSATLIALGADRIVFGQHGELGPIDASWSWKRVIPSRVPGGPGFSSLDTVSIEDVMAYDQYVRSNWGLRSDEALASALEKLTDRVDPVQLGSIYRSKTHMRQTAGNIINSRRDPPGEAMIDRIVDALTIQVHAHNHAISLDGAKSMGLPAELAEPRLELLMWQLFEDFEEDMKLAQPLDPAAIASSTDLYEEDAVIVAIESARAAHHLAGRIEVRAKRNLPPGLVINVNVNISPPPNVDVKKDEAAWSVILDELRASTVKASAQAVRTAVAGYGVVAAESALRSPMWVRTP